MIEPYKADFQLFNADDTLLRSVASEIQRRGIAVFHEQDLDESKFIQLIKRIGECETPGKFMNPTEFPEISLVTARRDEHGQKVGMFGDGELGWHSNGNSRHMIDKILISLFCVKSDPNSTLSVCQTSQPFYDLTTEEQEYWKSIKIRLQFKNNTMYQLEENDPEYLFMSQHRGSIRRLVDKHPVTGQYYFYFPYFFIMRAWEGNKEIDHLEMIERLKPIIFKSKYQHHVVFRENDLVMMDQFTTLHRRTPVTQDRLLWRIASDYKIITPCLEGERLNETHRH